jgi:Cytochrome c3
MMSKRTIKRSVAIAVVFICVTVSSVFYAAVSKEFSHVEHAKNDAECKNCHVIDTASGKMTHKNDECGDCHDEAIEGVRLPGKSKQPPLRFSHETHAAAFECTDCHKETISDSHKKGAPFVAEKRCNKCHDESGIEINKTKCKSCHAKDARKLAPKDHSKTWKRTHGRRSTWGSKVHDLEQCSTCHKKSECVTCHRSNKPKSHTGLWRMRTHGTSAAFDRDRCKTCHETGSCVFCHRTTSPLNHRGPWTTTHGLTAASRGSERCNVCHSTAVFCTPCHRRGQ